MIVGERQRETTTTDKQQSNNHNKMDMVKEKLATVRSKLNGIEVFEKAEVSVGGLSRW